ncbi:MAG: transglutaminase domain-containing protein [Anaerolineales bacterium]|nr:transglutaminase domain-containing protein [Anaerolineales bacterium]
MQIIRWLLLFLWLSFLVACQVITPEPTPGPLQQTWTDPGLSTVNEPEMVNPSAISVIESREYELQERFQIVNHGPGMPSKHNLWIALIGNLPPYQEVMEMSISPQNYQVFSDEYGNQIAEFDLTGLAPGNSIQLEINYQVRVNRLAYDLSDCQGELPAFFTSPELHIESNNPQIRSLSSELSQGNSTACEQARAFYDYIGNHLVYSYNGKSWGAQAALGQMGADCSEYASLMIALCRAAGIPARYLEGVLFLSETSEELARSEHAWLEVYLPNIGWVPMDPTLGRSSVFREQNFAANNPDHIIVTRGRNPSPLRGSSYYTHIYWPGKSASIKVEDFHWLITLIE